MGGALKQSTKIQRNGSAVTRGGRIRGGAAIASLASPVRQEIVDTVEALGGVATIAELAARLGRPADGLYYHVRRLAKAGLLVREDGDGAERFRTPVPRGGALALDYRPDDPRNAAAIRRVIGGMLRIARRDFDAALAIPNVVAHGPRRALWAGRGKGWVTADELEELNALCARATAILRRPRAPGRDRLVSLCFVLAPIAPRASRRARSGGGGPRRTS
jgi:hypothetical protein